jgi:general secretion pathway protein J
MMQSRQSNAGLTLIELLVAVAIFGLLAVMAYGSLSRLLDQRERLETEQRFWRELSMVFLRLDDDFAHARERPVRDVSGFALPAFRGQPTDPRPTAESSVEFTRGGELDYGGGRRSDLRRIEWRLRDGAIERLTWPVLDRAPTSEPVVAALLGGVEEFELRFLSANSGVQQRWPPQTTGAATDVLPRAVEVTITIDGRGSFTRQFVVGR